MRTNTMLAGLLAVLLIAGCRVKESENAEGETKYEIEPAPVEIGTDTATVKVPDIKVAPDTAADTTTTR